MEFGLIGKKLGHSFSPLIHNEFANYDYQLVELSEDELYDFLNKKDFMGLNVTIPYKEEVMKYLFDIEDIALKIGAVNTILNVDGKLIGYNTDYYGLKYLLNSNGINVKGLKCAVLGSGGASKMANVLLDDLGAKEIITVSRTGKYNYNNQGEYNDVELIINASPVGMYPNNDECLIDIENFSNIKFVVDLVYNPLVTELMFRANKKGIKAVNGLSMLVAQARRASQLFASKEIAEESILTVTKKIEKEVSNVVFIGMPGSGKSTMARLTAKFLNKEYLDTDELFTKSYGISPSECILNEGEEEFRKKESAVIKEVCKKSGKIIATGGGAVLKEENQKAIKSNGKCIFIDRDINLLSNEDRPLSSSPSKIKELYEKREPIYRKLADFTVVAQDTVEDTFEKIKEILVKE